MRYASRFLLPLEMMLGLYTLIWGLSGGGQLGQGALYFALLATEHNFVWCVALGTAGMATFLVTLLEWSIGRRFTPCQIHKCVSARACLAFVMVGTWIGAAVVLSTAPSMDRIAIILPAAAMHVAFSFWVYVENLKTRYMLDDKIPTSTLQLSR